MSIRSFFNKKFNKKKKSSDEQFIVEYIENVDSDSNEIKISKYPSIVEFNTDFIKPNVKSEGDKDGNK